MVHYNRTNGYVAACDGYVRDVSPDEPCTLILHETTCLDCQELLEVEVRPDADVCTVCGAIGPWFGGPEAICPSCLTRR